MKTYRSVIFLSSSGVTSAPCRSVKKSVVSKSLKKVVQSTILTQVSNLAILDKPPWAINLASRFLDSGEVEVWDMDMDFESRGRESAMAEMRDSSLASSIDSANSWVKVSATCIVDTSPDGRRYKYSFYGFATYLNGFRDPGALDDKVAIIPHSITISITSKHS
jgi:hypothetical protein